MRLRFLGHAAFSLELGGVRLCLDPHRPGALGGRMQLPAIQGPFDAIACSHGHEDHAAWTEALGTLRWIDGADRVGEVEVTVRAAFHDAVLGTRMGMVRMLSFRAEGLRVVHCGDIGAFDADDVAWLAGTDVLLVPVGGTYTLDGPAAADFARQVQARWTVPMHAADPRIDLPLAPVDAFLAAWSGAVRHADTIDTAAAPPPGVVVLAAPE